MPQFLGTSPLQALYLGTTPIQALYLGLTIIWQNEVQIILPSNVTGLIMADLAWPAGVWAGSVTKRVIVPQGRTITGASWGAIAPQGGGNGVATWGGRLILEIRGDVFGVGGLGNGGIGGAALYDESGYTPSWGKKVDLLITATGRLFAGGGGGGQGGKGGDGFVDAWQYEGPAYDGNYRVAQGSYPGVAPQVKWAGGVVGGPTETYTPNAYVGSFGGWDYYQVNLRDSYGDDNFYYDLFEVRRQRLNRSYIGGAAGGGGGRGQGHDGVNAGGAGGGNNGGNTGVGGTGGTGGTWGNPGSTGGTGANGNNGAGSGGAGGGAAGVAYRTLIWNLLSNAGSILGRVT